MSDMTMGELADLIPNVGNSVQIGGYIFQMEGIYNDEGEEISMKHYEVEVGDPEGISAQTLDLQDRTEKEVRVQALDTEVMVKNPTWVVKKVTQK